MRNFALRFRSAADAASIATSYGYGLVFALTLYEVFARYVLKRPTSWTMEVCILLAGVHYLVSGISALARDQHIRVDALTNILPQPARTAFAVVEWAVVALVCCVLGWWAIEQAWVAIAGFERSGTQMNWPLPVILKSLVAFVLLAMAAAALVNLADWHLRGAGDVA